MRNCSQIQAGDYVGFEEVDDGIWSIYFGRVLLARLDERDYLIRG